MLYDSTPQYEHFAHLPYAKEPFKGLYVFQRLLTTLLLVPWWFIKYLVLPRSHRPRASWNLRQIIFVFFTKRIYRVTEVAGVNWATRDPDADGSEENLKETRFEWAQPLDRGMRRGVVVDRFGKVPFKRVGCFVWPKERKVGVMSPGNQTEDDAKIPVVGVFMHGGGYCQMSASEKARTSNIPRRLIKDNLVDEVYAVEYRLLQHAPLPAVIIDAATVYAHVVKKYYGDSYTDEEQIPSAPLDPAAPIPAPRKTKKVKIVLIGDSSGGNLVLALARWIRDEGVESGMVPMPDGLLLFSPSCDASHAFPPSSNTWHTPRPHADTDYLTDTPEPRLLLQKTFLGFKHQIEQSDLQRNRLFMLSGAGNVLIEGVGSVYNLGRSGMGSVVNLLRGNSSAAVNATTTATPNGTPALAMSTVPAYVQQVTITDSGGPSKVVVEGSAQDKLLQQIIHSEYVSPASPKVLKRWGHPVDLYDGSWMCGCVIDDESSPCPCDEEKDKDKRPGHERRLSWRRKKEEPKHAHTHVTLPASETASPDTSPMPAYRKPDGLDGNRSRRSSAASSTAMLPSSEGAYIPSKLSRRTEQDEEEKAEEEEEEHEHEQEQEGGPPRITITPSPPSPTLSSSSSPTLAPLGRKHRHLRTRAHREEEESSPISNYSLKYPKWKKLFGGFPRTLILCGDAERLTVEVGNLVRGMARDVDGFWEDGQAKGGDQRQHASRKIRIHWIPDGVHDVFIIPPGWWDEKTKDRAWEDVKSWIGEVKESDR